MTAAVRRWAESLETSASSVHTAAGCFISEEAGARVYDLETGNDWDLDTRSYLLSATPELHESLLQIVQECREQR